MKFKVICNDFPGSEDSLVILEKNLEKFQIIPREGEILFSSCPFLVKQVLINLNFDELKVSLLVEPKFGFVLGDKID